MSRSGRRTQKANVEKVLEKAATQHITADELELLVLKTRELTLKREQELSQIKSLLSELESRLNR